jgi:hypothetical protein
MTYPIGLTFDDGTVTRGPAPAPTVITEPVVMDLSAIGDPYGATQCDETIRDGDVLVFGDGEDRVVGFMCGAWPVERIGFHTLDPDADVRTLGADRWGRSDVGGYGPSPIRGGADYSASVKLAQLQDTRG